MNIKKIIAREGLIILSCTMLTLILFYFDTFIPNTKLPYQYSISTGGHKYKLLGDKLSLGDFSDSDKGEFFQSLVKRFPSDFNATDLSVIKFNGYPSDLKIEYQGKQDIKETFFNIALCSLFVYPIYLLFRFIVWAIKTLRSK